MQSPGQTGEHEKIRDPIVASGAPSVSPGLVEPVNTVQPEKKKRGLPMTIVAILIIGIGLGAMWVVNNNRPAKKAVHAVTVPVTVKKAVVDSVPIEIRTVGNVLAYSVVNVQPQVGGQLAKVYFTAGAMVRKGDPLFQIDPRPFQATLEQVRGTLEKDQAQVAVAKDNLARDKASVGQFQANLRKDQAQLTYAKREATRYNSLFQQGAVSQEQGEQMSTSAVQADATIQADQKAIDNAKAVLLADKGQIDSAIGTVNADIANVHTAELNLSWCRITAPIDGRTGSLAIYEGNIVTANNTMALVTIEQVLPIYIQFTLPEQYLDEVQRNLRHHTLKVQALVEGAKADSVQGTVGFLDNTVNTTSGTINLRAVFNNQDRKLFPGQFVDVVVPMPPPGTSVVVPASAVQISQKGNAVYILQPDNTVKFVPVTMDRTFGDNAAISKGLSAGDTVVVDGQLQLTPGAKVIVMKGKLTSGDQDSSSDMPGSVGSDTDNPTTPTNAGDGGSSSSGAADTGTASSSDQDATSGSGHHHHHHGTNGAAGGSDSSNGSSGQTGAPGQYVAGPQSHTQLNSSFSHVGGYTGGGNGQHSGNPGGGRNGGAGGLLLNPNPNSVVAPNASNPPSSQNNGQQQHHHHQQ